MRSAQENLPKKILADVEAGKQELCYYLYGEEPFKIREFVEKLQNAFLGEQSDTSFSVDRLDGGTASVNDIIDAAATTGFVFGGGSSKRLIIVRQAQLLKNTEKLLKWSEEQESDFSSIVLFIAEGIDGRKKFHQWLKQKGRAVEFKKATDRELVQWAQYLAKKRGVSLSNEACDALAVLCDGSLYRLDQEIEKAWLFKGGSGEPLQLTDVSVVASHDISHQMSDLVSAVFEGKKVRALLACGKVIQNHEDALGFVGFCVWALKNPERFRSASHIVNEGRSSFLIEKLRSLDGKLKGSGLEPQSLLSEFIVQVTEQNGR